MLKKRWHNGGTNLQIMRILSLTRTYVYWFRCIHCPLKHSDQIRPWIHRVIFENIVCLMADLICILWGYCRWRTQFLIACVVFLEPENIRSWINWFMLKHTVLHKAISPLASKQITRERVNIVLLSAYSSQERASWNALSSNDHQVDPSGTN